MKPTLRFATALTALLALTSPVAAQQTPRMRASLEPAAAAAAPTTETEATGAPPKRPGKGPADHDPVLRPLDKRGINVFETTKEPGVEFTGFKLDFGAAFTSQVQNLSHRNTAAPNLVNGVNANQLAEHRIRLQQLDGQRRAARAARARDPRRS